MEAVKRIDALFDIERSINGETAELRLAVRREQSAPFLADLENWMRTELSRHAPVARAMDYMLKRWDRFARSLADVLARIAGTPQNGLHKLLPWHWQDGRRHDQTA